MLLLFRRYRSLDTPGKLHAHGAVSLYEVHFYLDLSFSTFPWGLGAHVSSTSINFAFDLPGTTTPYYMNQYLINDFIAVREDLESYAPVSYQPVLLSNLDAPSSDIAVAEMNPLNTSGSNDLSFPAQHTTQWESGSALTAMRVGAPHSGGMNMIYCDGHVKWMSATVYENPANISLWYPGYVN